MEGRKLLYVQVFNGRQKLLKLSLKTFFLWIFLKFHFFPHLYTYLELKSIRCSTGFWGKNDSWFDRKKELEAMRERREWFFVCCILDIDYSWMHSTHMHWWNGLFNKREILAPSRLNILSIFLYWVQKIRAEKDNNKVKCC